MINARQHIVAAIIAIGVVAPTMWMLLDRDPPHKRDNGQILADDPMDCGLPPDAPRGAIYPGSCIAVDWKVKTIRTCRPSTENSVTRTIKDSQGKIHTLAPVVAFLGKADPTRRELVRNFVLPSGIPPGPATYSASACFTCNPLHVFFPVCVEKPDISFEIEKPP